MTFWTAIVIIIAIVCGTELIKSKHRAQHGILRDGAGNEKPAARIDAELQREVEQLRERVKVLERIATEDRETKQLSAEIERLRGE
jgi:hypothetical protein